MVELNAGELKYRLASGREVSYSIAEIDYLQIAGWPLFNLAEKQHREKRYRPAIAAYERTLSELRDKSPVSPKPGADVLVRCRLVRACDADGQFDRAIEWYLQVLESPAGGAAYLDRIRPVQLPPADSGFMNTAAAAVDAAIQRHQGDAIGASLAAWRDGWSTKSETRPAAQPKQPSTRDAQHTQQAEIIAAAARLAEAGKGAEALERLQKCSLDALGPSRPDFHYWQARAFLAIGQQAHTEEDLTALRRAGLALIRVVIHFPDHSRAPECLLRAGEICARTGQPEQAVALWSELLRNYPEAVPWAEQARRRLYQSSLSPTSGRPAGPASQPAERP